jgi:threonine dehydrogenase-like Zn-dependent dehydrogenase
MQALELRGPGQVVLTAVPEPVPAPDQLLVATGAATICTSDLIDIRANPFRIPLPVILGHEAAGVVEGVGARVQGFAPGDRVVAHPVHPCGTCGSCRGGLAHLCLRLSHFGIDLPGTFAERFAVRSDRARHLPAGVPFAVGALAEPVCVCLEALAQARVPTKGALLIIGDGPFGLLLARLARHLGQGELVLAGHEPFRLGHAREARTICTRAAADPVACLLDAGDQEGYGAVILAVSSAAAARDAVSLLAPRGRLVLFSALPAGTELDLWRVHARELEIVGACNDQDRLDAAVELLGRPELALSSLVTHTFPLAAFEAALELAARGHDQALKVAFGFALES